MKKHFLKLVFPAIAVFAFTIHVRCQVADYIYGISNESSGVFHFSKVNIGTGEITNLSLMPMSSISSAVTACVDNHQHYYFCAGNSMMVYDAVTGNLISNSALPTPNNADFFYTQFNPVDSNIYGIVNNYPSNNLFAKYNPYTQVMTTICQLSNFNSFLNGGLSFIDLPNNRYVFQYGNICGLDMTTGQILFDTPIQNLPNEQFGHIGYNSSTQQIIGTSANANQGRKYLSSFNTSTGAITHISATGWAVGIWKPSIGGACVDQVNGVFYYSGSPDMLIGVDAASGNLLTADTVNAGMGLYCVQHFDQSVPLIISNNTTTASDLKIFPNPFSSEAVLQFYNPTSDATFILYNSFGQIVRITDHISEQQLIIERENLMSGLYYYSLIAGDKTRSGKLIVE